jgi:ElaB/YqjD/DUF883 family membrane-anchored ribosome-binding protein
MAKKEDPEELQRQKEDIENLLSSLETAFSEGSITQEHYNEVKQKNTAKLDEIKKKLPSQPKKQEPYETEPATGGKAPEGRKASVDAFRPETTEPSDKEKNPKKQEQQKEPAKEPSKDAPKEEDKKGMLDAIAERLKGQKDEDTERVKEKIIMELSPKMDKMNVRIVKLKAFVDALKEEKGGDREAIQRITEEVGEARSMTTNMEGRMSEIEMKLEDVSETITDLKPQRFAKELQKKEEEIKMHEARLEKLDDMNSTILKRVNQIQIILEKLGNIESIADMTKDISKKLVSIDDREKKITRLADKIDSMFVEINKRLEEFMFYKAKQDSLDDLTKETMKSIDELTTKLTRYAEKDDMELLRDTLENKINTMAKESAVQVPTATVQVQQDRSEIEALMKLLEEQYKKGQMSKKDYEKAREANMKKLKEMGDQKPPQSPSPPTPTYSEPAAPMEPEVPEEAPEPDLLPEVTQFHTSSVQTTVPEKPEKPEPVQEPTKITKEKPEKKEPTIVKVAKSETKEPITVPSKPEPAKEKPADGGKASQEKEVGKIRLPAIDAFKPIDKKKKMLSDLEDSFRKGLISQKAYEATQKIIMSKRMI